MGRSPCCEKKGLKKGKWTAEEDEKLINYIKANGEGSWRSLPKNAGLLRCGKSCRLRWFNYLREDLKRGNFTPQEEETIVRLQRNLGNRWSLIASYLPGRTDNEIKNYWNSHLSRKIYIFRSINVGPTPDMFKMISPDIKRYKSKSTNSSMAQKPTTTVKPLSGPADGSSGPDYPPGSGPGPAEEPSGLDYQPEPDEMSSDKDMDRTDSPDYPTGHGPAEEPSGPNYQSGPDERPGNKHIDQTYSPDYPPGLGPAEELSGPNYRSSIGPGPGPAEEPSGPDYQPGPDEEMLMHLKNFLEDESVGDGIVMNEEKDFGPFGPNSESGDVYACLSPLVNSYFNDEEVLCLGDNFPCQELNMWSEEEIIIW